VGKGRRPFHDIKVSGGRFNNVKNKFMFNTTNFVGIPCKENNGNLPIN
jgi:hypothetical protein